MNRRGRDEVSKLLEETKLLRKAVDLRSEKEETDGISLVSRSEAGSMTEEEREERKRGSQNSEVGLGQSCGPWQKTGDGERQNINGIGRTVAIRNRRNKKNGARVGRPGTTP